jgi:ABC-type uncharacterized transport system permease subunit
MGYKMSEKGKVAFVAIVRGAVAFGVMHAGSALAQSANKLLCALGLVLVAVGFVTLITVVALGASECERLELEQRRERERVKSELKELQRQVGQLRESERGQ